MPENGIFVEVGVWKGQSLSYFIIDSINKNKNIQIYAVDSFEGSAEHFRDKEPSIMNKTLFTEFTNNMKTLESRYKCLKMPSEEAYKIFADNSIDILFLDAAHDYENVSKDLRNWYPKIKQGGILAGHDYSPGWPVVIAVDEFYKDKQNEIINFGDDCCWITRKK